MRPHTVGVARRYGQVAIALAVATLGCAIRRSAVAPGSGDPMTITRDQIVAVQADNAWDAVQRLHGDFLVSRGRESLNPNVPPIPVHVFVDDTYYGGVSTLRNIPASDIAAIHLYQSYEAQYKFGSGHMGGVIQVITRN